MRKKAETKIIGVMGTQARVGTTSLTIMLANYLTNVCGKNVALLEYGNKSDVKWLKNNGNTFKLKGINFFTNTFADKIPELIAKGFDYIVIDFSSDYYKARSEFLRCHKQIVIGDVNDWNVVNYHKFIERTGPECNVEKWKYTAVFGMKDSKLYLETKNKITVHGIPFNPHMLKIPHNSLQLMEELLK